MRGRASLARFCRIRVTTPDGPRFNEPFAADLELDATAPIEGARLGLTFNTVEGQRILTLDSDAEARTFGLPIGRAVLRLSLPRLPLHPGRYYCNAALGVGRHYYDMVDGFALWEVHSGRNDWESDRRFGGCRLLPELTVCPPPSAA